MSELPFPVQEFEGRLEHIRAKMRDRALSTFIVTRPENIFYVTGYRAAHIANRTSELHALIIPASAEPRLIVRALEAETVLTQWSKSPKLFMDHEDPYRAAVEILAEAGSRSGPIGIEERFLRVNQFKKLAYYLADATFVDCSGLIEGLAASPSPAESACVRAAAQITDLGLKTGLREIKLGVYPFEVIGKIHNAMYAAGQTDFDKALVAIWSGPKGGHIHDTLTTEKIKVRDIVTIEIMGVHTHYRAGAQACVYVGAEPPATVTAAYDLVTRMHAEAKAAVRAGVQAGEVFDAANAVYRAAMGVDYFRRCGGSMGLTQFALDLVKGRTDVLRPGVALLIQTLVDDPALLTCASTVIVTADGCEEVTQPVARPMLTAC